MNNKRLVLVVICIALLLPSSSVYAVDLQGTYYGSLDTQAGTSISITVESETVDYDDYYSYEVNLNKDQIVDVTLEVPGGADFDLFFTTANMDLWWYDLSDVEGQDENQVITVPESGDYLFVVAGYSGDGSYTLRWTSTNSGVDMTLILGIIAAVVIIAVVVLVLLLMRRRKSAPPETPRNIPPPPPPT
jgi:hypothetical protein